MPQEAIRQRIKYLIEHGEVYPKGLVLAHDGRMRTIAITLLALNTVQTTLIVGRYFM